MSLILIILLGYLIYSSGQRFCDDIIVIFCQLYNKTIFNILSENLSAFVLMFSKVMLLVMKITPILSMNTITGSSTLTITLCNSWSTKMTSFTVSDAATLSTLNVDNDIPCWALDLHLIGTPQTQRLLLLSESPLESLSLKEINSFVWHPSWMGSILNLKSFIQN